MGLRAVAVILVVAYNAGPGLVSGGYVGIDVFLVVSGFLITTVLYGELETRGGISLARFYARRATRVLPASTIVVVATVIAAWHWMPGPMARRVSVDALAVAGYGLNMRVAADGGPRSVSPSEVSPLRHLWALTVVEQFYLVIPLALLFASVLWRRRGGWSAAAVLGAVGAVSFGLCVRNTGHEPAWMYFGSQTRVWELVAGALVALGARSLHRLRPVIAAAMSWLGLAAVLCAALVFTDTTPYPDYPALLPVGGAVLLIAGGCAAPRHGVTMLLGLGPAQEIGRLSFSWYLWHWPVLVLAPYVLGHHQPTLWIRVALAVVTLVPASMSLAAVESRVRIHRVFRSGPRRGIVLGATLTATVAAVALVTLKLPTTVPDALASDGTRVGDSPRSMVGEDQLTGLIGASVRATVLPDDLVPPLSTAAKDSPREGACIASLDERSIGYNVGQGCEQRGDLTAPTTVVLFGDSSAEQWFDPLNEVALRWHWRLVVFLKDGCTPASALTFKGTTTQPYAECTQWRQEALRRMVQLRPAMVVMSGRTGADRPIGTAGPADRAWTAAWLATATAIRETGAVPVILQETPDPGVSVPDCVAANPLALGRCDLDPETALNDVHRHAVAATTKSGIRVVDTASWFCTATVCPAVVGNVLVYRDDRHATATYLKALAPMLASQLS
jgi:peptidoglycan/LPS O-acetylase OafA/YrhL